MNELVTLGDIFIRLVVILGGTVWALYWIERNLKP